MSPEVGPAQVAAVLEALEATGPQVFAAARRPRLELLELLRKSPQGSELERRARALLSRIEVDEARFVSELAARVAARRLSPGELLTVVERHAGDAVELEADESDALFDRLCGVRTAGSSLLPYAPHQIPYVPAPLRFVLAALRLLELEPGEVFCDVGAGRGRVVALAALASAARVTGVELQPELCGEARRLLSALGLAGEIVCADAVTHAWEADACFFFEPLGAPLLLLLLERLSEVARRRPLRFAVLGPSARTFLAQPWLTLTARDGELHRFDSVAGR